MGIRHKSKPTTVTIAGASYAQSTMVRGAPNSANSNNKGKNNDKEKEKTDKN